MHIMLSIKNWKVEDLKRKETEVAEAPSILVEVIQNQSIMWIHYLQFTSSEKQ